MDLTKIQIAEAFSRSDFKITYPYLSDHIVWKVINNYKCEGKEKVIAQCEMVTKYFKSITTDFNQLEVIENGNKIAITGTAELSNNGQRIEFISACDIYQFDDNHKLLHITNYCVVEKELKE